MGKCAANSAQEFPLLNPPPQAGEGAVRICGPPILLHMRSAGDSGAGAMPIIHPPKPRLTLCIGVAGHRPDKQRAEAVERIAAQLRSVFAAIDTAAQDILAANKDCYADEPRWCGSCQVWPRVPTSWRQ